MALLRRNPRRERVRSWALCLALVVATGSLPACRQAWAQQEPPGRPAEPGVVGAAAAGAATAVEAEAASLEVQRAATDRLVPPTQEALGTPANVDPEMWRAAVPSDNPMTAERVALGRQLFFDPRLSADGSVACATCHDATRGFAEARRVSKGIRGQLGHRNAPSAANAALLASQFLDGREPTVDAQAKMPIVNPIEMGFADGAAAAAAIAALPEYEPLFQAAFGRSANHDDIGRAIGAFERTLIFLDAPFDRFVRGEATALSEEARRGWELFNGKARCVSCHPVSPAGPLFTDDHFHNIGVAARHRDFADLARRAVVELAADSSGAALERLALATDMSELGRFMVTRNRSDIGAFRTSQLRNVGVTSPYMHDGSLDTLWDVLDHYNKGGEANPFLDGGMVPLALTEEEIDQVVAFLFALTSDRWGAVNAEEFERQRALSRTNRPMRDDDLAFRRRLAFEPETTGAPVQGATP